MRTAVLAGLVLTSCSVASCTPRPVWHIEGTCFANQCAKYGISFSLQANEIPDLYVWSEGREVEHCKLAPSDDRYKRLTAWLHAHADSWASPAPQNSLPAIAVTAKQFELKFMQSGVAILAAGGRENWRRVESSDYDYLRCNAGP